MTDVTMAAFSEMVDAALREDLRTGDVTSEALVPEDLAGRARLVAREPMVACGLSIARLCFERTDPGCSFVDEVREGDRIDGGVSLASVSGQLRGLLSAERVALNFVQRACGIATTTRDVVDLVEGTGVEILDTRKTAPGLRALDKHAVCVGGGVNHRSALDDMIMVKDNHVAAVGSLSESVARALERGGDTLRVEVEVDSLEQLDELLGLPRLPHVVMLDNFTPDLAAEGVRRVAGRVRVELSGGITRENVRAHAEAGPDCISLGFLTHSVRAADVGMDLSP